MSQACDGLCQVGEGGNEGCGELWRAAEGWCGHRNPDQPPEPDSALLCTSSSTILQQTMIDDPRGIS